MEIRIPPVNQPGDMIKPESLPEWGTKEKKFRYVEPEVTHIPETTSPEHPLVENPKQPNEGKSRTIQHDARLINPYVNRKLSTEQKHRLMLWLRENTYVTCPHCGQTRNTCFSSRPGKVADLGLALCRNPHCEQGFSLYTVRIQNRDGTPLEGLPSWITQR